MYVPRKVLTMAPAFALVVAAVGCSDDAALQSANAEIAKGNQTIASLTEQVAQKDGLLAEANAEIERGNTTLASLNASVAQANEAIEDFANSNAEWEKDYGTLTVAYDALATTHEALTTTHEALTVAHDALAQQKAELEGALAATESKRAAVEELLAKVEKDLASLRGAAGSANTLEERAAELEEEIAELQERHRRLTHEYASLQTAYQSFLEQRCAIRSDEAPYGGTVSITPDILGPADPTSLESITYMGRGERRLYDYRPSAWITVNAYLFSVSYGHVELEFQVNPEFGSREAAREQVDAYAAALGRIPSLLLARGEKVHLNDGPGSMGGNWSDRSFTISADRGEEHIRRGTIEEVFVHEGAHVSLDRAHRNTQGWREAQMKDCASISRYARDNPTREDFAETILPYFALRYLPDRLTDADKAAIRNTIPNRIVYLDEQGLDLSTPE